eukprot:185115_1
MGNSMNTSDGILSCVCGFNPENDDDDEDGSIPKGNASSTLLYMNTNDMENQSIKSDYDHERDTNNNEDIDEIIDIKTTAITPMDTINIHDDDDEYGEDDDDD